MTLTCGVIIATHNRKADLERALGEISRLVPRPFEVTVCADACTDGTQEFVRKSHLDVRLLENATSLGSIGSREMMMRLSESDIILSFDDDSHPVEADFVRGVCELFEKNPRLAVASFPQYSNEFPESLAGQDFGPSHFTGFYASSSAAIRRSAYFEVGGYASLFHHVYEEPDFALRCIAAGWQVRFETSLHVRHLYSGAQRNELKIHHLQARNELWSVMLRCPFPYIVAVAAFRIVRQFGYAATRGIRWALQEPRWWLSFLAGLPRCLAQRSPVAWEHYRHWMNLLRDPVCAQAECEKRFGYRASS